MWFRGRHLAHLFRYTQIAQTQHLLIKINARRQLVKSFQKLGRGIAKQPRRDELIKDGITKKVIVRNNARGIHVYEIQGRFKGVALVDNNLNYRFDREAEQIAFLDSAIHIQGIDKVLPDSLSLPADSLLTDSLLLDTLALCAL